jgi:hypothetical protein
MHVKLGQANWQTVRVGIVLVVIRLSLSSQFRRPWLERQLTILEACADIEKLS